MKIILVTEAFGPQGFGVGQVLLRLVRLCRENGVALKVLSPIIEDKENFLAAEEFIDVPYTGKKFLWHPLQQNFFEKVIASFKPDLIHIHGVFTFVQRSAIQAATKVGIPILLSSHGMLDPIRIHRDTRSNGYALLKKLYWVTLMKPVLRKVDYIHAITEVEATYLKQEFPTIPQILIPNLIDVNQSSGLSIRQPLQKIFVFLGRLHPIKGVDLLIRAFQQAQFDHAWRLVIAGPDFNLLYSQQLRRLVIELGLANRVDFIGPVYGEEKHTLLAKAWMVVVPSYSEVVALVNLEAAAVQTPTITTTGTGLYDWAESGGFLVEAKVESLTSALKNAATWTMEERRARGTQARAFVQERYSWQVIGPRWIEAYQKIACKVMA